LVWVLSNRSLKVIPSAGTALDFEEELCRRVSF
jgi:hypothetical protein